MGGDDDDDDGSSERLSQVYLDGMAGDMVGPNPACPLVSGSALIALTSSRSLTLSRTLAMSLPPFAYNPRGLTKYELQSHVLTM